MGQESMNLELLPIDDLLDELGNRFDHTVFMGLKLRDLDNAESTYRVNGGRFICLGLCEELKDQVKYTFDEDIEEGECDCGCSDFEG